MAAARARSTARPPAETRERVFEAAVEEFKKKGVAAADIRAVVEAAGVARGTFYFHFPTKHHVLAEIERREDLRMSAQLARFFAGDHDVEGALREVARVVLLMERRLGGVLFREVLAQHFLMTGPVDDSWENYRIIVMVVAELRGAWERGEIAEEADPVAEAEFFLLGLYAVLAALHNSNQARGATVEKYLVSTLRSLTCR